MVWNFSLAIFIAVFFRIFFVVDFYTRKRDYNYTCPFTHFIDMDILFTEFSKESIHVKGVFYNKGIRYFHDKIR